MVLLVGYISAGSVLKAGMKFDEVLITVNVPLGDGFKLVTKAKVIELNQLMDGKINTSQFVRKIKYL
jgi:tryptophan synthase alpha subunit